MSEPKTRLMREYTFVFPTKEHVIIMEPEDTLQLQRDDNGGAAVFTQGGKLTTVRMGQVLWNEYREYERPIPDQPAK